MKTCISGALSLALLASGCASTGTGTSTGITKAQFIADAQVAAETLCAIAPTAETITTIALTVAGGGAAAMASDQLAEVAAEAFCKAVPVASAAVTKLGAHKRLGASLVSGVVDYGPAVIGGHKIELQGTPVR